MINIFRSRQVILLYHRIADVPRDPWGLCVTPEHFLEHLQILRKHAPIALAAVKPRSRSLSRKQLWVALTFDDGYADNFSEAAPLLDRFQMPATFFIVTGCIGKSCEFWWDELERLIFGTPSPPSIIHVDAGGRADSFHFDANVGPAPLYFSLYDFLQPLVHEEMENAMSQLRAQIVDMTGARPAYRPMTRTEVCKLAQNRLFEIGAHTVTHPKLSALPALMQAAEIARSKVALEDLLGRPVTSFSYPFGGRHHYAPDSVRSVREAGFARACTTEAHLVTRADTFYELPRFRVTDMDGQAFEAFLTRLST